MTGKRGEAAVAGFLAAKGHKIVARNWRSGHLELDIVSLDGSGLHFVEVKTRTSSDIAAPQENVGAVKQRRLAEAAKRFLAGSRGQFWGMEVFFDIAAVLDCDNHLEINYFPNAFIPTH
ncbi:MAG: YraN family protein [Bacteroidales bacterium]|nr:YraN family protein [Bacteroidales bacterium]